MKTIDERLKSKGITPKTKHHNYDYLYKSIVQLMQEYEDEIITLKESIEKNPPKTDGIKYLASICKKCGMISNHDEMEEDVCVHCGERYGEWQHIYDEPS